MPEQNTLITIPLQVSLGFLQYATDAELKRFLGDAAVQAARKELAKRLVDG